MPTISRLDISKLGAFKFDDSTLSPAPIDSSDVITFNDYGLQNANIITERVVYSGPSRSITKRDRMRTDGAFVEDDRFQENRITISGHLAYSTRALMETAMDRIRKELATPNAVLKIPWQSGSRYFDCYVSNMSAMFDGREHHHITTCPFQFEITCFDPYARNVSRETFTAPTSITGAETSLEIGNTGSAKTDPIYYLTFISAGTVTNITLENTETGEAITLAETFATGDYITINGETKEVLKNGSVIDYSGIFPRLQSGMNKHTITINTGGGATISFGARYYLRYL